MEHSIKSLAARLNQVQTKRKTVLEKAQSFEESLREAFGDTEIYGTSSDVTLDQVGHDDYVYGHLSYDRRTGLNVAYRTTDEDHYDSFHGTPDEDRGYSIKDIPMCSPLWLEHLFVEKNLASLLENLGGKIDEMGGRVDESLGALEKILTAESAEIDNQMIAALKQCGNETLSKNWSTAHAAVNYDPADSLTRSSSFLESVCTKILMERGAELPQTKTVATLVDACLAALAWPAANNVQDDVKKISAGLKTISLGVASLRTHFGTAHGVSVEQMPLDASFARLSNNAAAAVAIFLLSRHFKGGT